MYEDRNDISPEEAKKIWELAQIAQKLNGDAVPTSYVTVTDSQVTAHLTNDRVRVGTAEEKGYLTPAGNGEVNINTAKVRARMENAGSLALS